MVGHALLQAGYPRPSGSTLQNPRDEDLGFRVQVPENREALNIVFPCGPLKKLTAITPPKPKENLANLPGASQKNLVAKMIFCAGLGLRAYGLGLRA